MHHEDDAGGGAAVTGDGLTDHGETDMVLAAAAPFLGHDTAPEQDGMLAVVDPTGLSLGVRVGGFARLGGAVCGGDEEHRPMPHLTTLLARAELRGRVLVCGSMDAWEGYLRACAELCLEPFLELFSPTESGLGVLP